MRTKNPRCHPVTCGEALVTALENKERIEDTMTTNSYITMYTAMVTGDWNLHEDHLLAVTSFEHRSL
jgi:hypothetical protein